MNHQKRADVQTFGNICQLNALMLLTLKRPYTLNWMILTSDILNILFFFFFPLFRVSPWHMEVPRLGIQLELKCLPA